MVQSGRSSDSYSSRFLQPFIHAMKKNQQIRNSTAEFLIFAMQGDAEGIEVRLEDDTVWLTQQMLAELYGTTKQNISLHILNIYEEEELSRESTVKDFLTVRNEGNRKVNRRLEYYNLDAPKSRKKCLDIKGYRMI